MYYQRKIERLHFCRPSLHTLLHIAPETPRLGPPICYTQWTMERTIGNLGEEIKQPSKLYANLSQRGIRRCQVNAIKAMIPDFDSDEKNPVRGSMDIGDGYILHRARDDRAHKIPDPESAAVRSYCERQGSVLNHNWTPRIQRWARLQLPTGQIARSAWKEKQKALTEGRMSRNVKVCACMLTYY